MENLFDKYFKSYYSGLFFFFKCNEENKLCSNLNFSTMSWTLQTTTNGHLKPDQ